jgi:hypothetical protein
MEFTLDKPHTFTSSNGLTAGISAGAKFKAQVINVERGEVCFIVRYQHVAREGFALGWVEDRQWVAFEDVTWID